ncbi:hypothetical protein [Leptothrix ochracea]|uniref:hypothetical protein n=1 Tax=Leptothrix ochracea TaxID=735331 RepID=UPI0034E2D4D8
MRSPHTAPLAILGLLVLSLLSSSCASSLYDAEVEVTSFGEWPDDRPAGTYVFQRLPSQRGAVGTANALQTTQDATEAAAAEALLLAGFTLDSDAVETHDPDVDIFVQVSARSVRMPTPWLEGSWVSQHNPWSKDVWGRPLRRPLGMGPSQGWSGRPYELQQEVIMLLIDGMTHHILYEGHARTRLNGTPAVLRALFSAILQGFPDLPDGPRDVMVSLVPLTPPPEASAPR